MFQTEEKTASTKIGCLMRGLTLSLESCWTQSLPRILPPRLAPWRYERGQRSLLVNFAQATGGSIAAAGAGANEASGANVGLEEDGDFGQGFLCQKAGSFLPSFATM
jgi:hypothetical protein